MGRRNVADPATQPPPAFPVSEAGAEPDNAVALHTCRRSSLRSAQASLAPEGAQRERQQDPKHFWPAIAFMVSSALWSGRSGAVSQAASVLGSVAQMGHASATVLESSSELFSNSTATAGLMAATARPPQSAMARSRAGRFEGRMAPRGLPCLRWARLRRVALSCGAAHVSPYGGRSLDKSHRIAVSRREFRQPQVATTLGS